MKKNRKSFFENYLRTFYNPSRSFSDVLSGNYFRDGFLFMLIPLVLYTLMYIMLYLGNGAPSTFTPWLNIPTEHYYFYNQFLVAPSMLLAWFASAAFLQVISHSANGTGTFEQTLAILGLSISVAMWSTLLHDLMMSFLSAIHLIDAKEHEIAMNSPTIWRTVLWICFSVYLIAFTSLFYKTVRVVHELGRWKSFLIGMLTFFLFQGIFLIFNR
jgi:hypothetical protein